MLNEQGEEILEEGALPLKEVEETNLESESGESEQVETDENEEGSNASEFKAKLEAEQERLGKKIDKEREKRIAAEKGGITREEVERIAEEKVSQVRKDVLRERAITIAERMAKSRAERDLILLRWETFPSSENLEEDIADIHAIVNRKATAGMISELKSSLKSRKTISGGGSDAGQPVEIKPLKKYSQEVLEGAKFAGVTPEEFVKKQKS